MLVILGPTSTGKTDLAITLAKKFNGELVSCDSRQVYKGLDIGTGKLPGGKASVQKEDGYWIINGVKVWMYDLIDFKKQYTVADFVKDADKVIREMKKRGKLPIIVGGTGLYLKALLYGLSDLSIPVNLNLRRELEDLSLERLQQRLINLSTAKWQSLNNSDKNNKRRLIRYIELIVMLPKRKILSSKIKNDLNILKIGLTAKKEILYNKINLRVDKWIEEGIVNEVEKLIQEGASKDRIKNFGLEYKVIVEYLDKSISLEEMIERIKTKIRQYARRQLTWFKREKDTFWFDINEKDFLDQVEKRIAKWYHLI